MTSKVALLVVPFISMHAIVSLLLQVQPQGVPASIYSNNIMNLQVDWERNVVYGEVNQNEGNFPQAAHCPTHSRRISPNNTDCWQSSVVACKPGGIRYNFAVSVLQNIDHLSQTLIRAPTIFVEEEVQRRE